MKRKTLIWILGLEALFCLALTSLQNSFKAAFPVVLAFPFEQISLVLRRLSLLGKAGNALAIVIYLGLGLLPAVLLLVRRKKRRLLLADLLLFLLCPVLLAVFYLMINPGYLAGLVGAAILLPVAKAVLGSMVYSILAGYLLLRLLGLFSGGGTKQLLRYMSIMLHLLAILYVYLISSGSFAGLLEAFTGTEIGSNQQAFLSSIFLVLQFLVSSLPYLVSILVVFAALDLLDELGQDRYSATAVAAAGRLTKKCSIALGVIVLSNIAFNLLQLLFIRRLSTLSTTVQIPIFAVIFVLAALLLTRFITEGKSLKDEHDLFV